MMFSFYYFKVDYLNGEKWVLVFFDFLKLKEILFEWQMGMYVGGGWNVLFWCNYDQLCIVFRYGDDGVYRVKLVKMFVIVIYMMQGMFYIYQGEELGMMNLKFVDISFYWDVELLNMYYVFKEKGMFD